jgi:hypothetical protein
MVEDSSPSAVDRGARPCRSSAAGDHSRPWQSPSAVGRGGGPRRSGRWGGGAGGGVGGGRGACVPHLACVAQRERAERARGLGAAVGVGSSGEEGGEQRDATLSCRCLGVGLRHTRHVCEHDRRVRLRLGVVGVEQRDERPNALCAEAMAEGTDEVGTEVAGMGGGRGGRGVEGGRGGGGGGGGRACTCAEAMALTFSNESPESLDMTATASMRTRVDSERSWKTSILNGPVNRRGCEQEGMQVMV